MAASPPAAYLSVSAHAFIFHASFVTERVASTRLHVHRALGSLAVFRYAVRCGNYFPDAVRCFVTQCARGAVFRDAPGQRTARGARGAVFRDTPSGVKEP